MTNFEERLEALQIQMDNLQAQIDAIQLQYDAIVAEQALPWPKLITLTAWTDSFSAQSEGERIGLTGDALHLFAQQDTVEIVYEVSEDGTSTKISYNGTIV